MPREQTEQCFRGELCKHSFGTKASFAPLQKSLAVSSNSKNERQDVSLPFSLRSSNRHYSILLCIVAAFFATQTSAQYLAYSPVAAAYSPYYYPSVYGYGYSAFGYPGYALWGSNKGGALAPSADGPAPSGLTGKQ